MRIKLTPDKGLRVEKARLNGVSTLILRPANREPANIGLMWIHGGGFITGMKEMVYMSRAANLVKRYGVAVFSPGYRLAWRKPCPAAAFLFGTIVLRFFGGFNIGHAALAAFPAAATGAATELFSPSEWDTVTVPAVVLITLMLATI